MSAVIELREACVELRHSSILSNVSVAFAAGRTAVVYGKAGSGKSVLLKTAAGLMVCDRGQVLFEGQDLSRMDRAAEMAFRRVSAFCFQDAALWANQTIRNNLQLPLSLHEPELSPGEQESRILEALSRVGYMQSPSFRPASLSVGEQKLVSFARALVLRPRLWFLDEPLAALDSDAAENLMGILRGLKQAGHTLIVVSNDPRLIAELGDDLCLVSGGKVVAFGAVDAVASLAGADLVRRIKRARSHLVAGDSLEQLL